MENSTRVQDVKEADIVSQFVIENFYRKIINNKRWSIQRIDSPSLQRLGVDYMIIPNQNADQHQIWYIDEKTTLLDYADTIPTQCFEISTYYLNESNSRWLIDGWFTNEDLKTTHYLFIWPTFKEGIKRISSTDDINNVRIIVIEKEKLWERLESYGFNKSFIMSEAKRLRCNCEHYNDMKDNEIISYDSNMVACRNTEILLRGRGIKLKYSEYKPEHAVNLVISKKILYSVSGGGYLVDKNNIVREKTWQEKNENDLNQISFNFDNVMYL